MVQKETALRQKCESEACGSISRMMIYQIVLNDFWSDEELNYGALIYTGPLFETLINRIGYAGDGQMHLAIVKLWQDPRVSSNIWSICRAEVSLIPSGPSCPELSVRYGSPLADQIAIFPGIYTQTVHILS